MSRKLLALSISATLIGGTAMADAPNVAVDIAPVHSLVARVMEGVGTPDLIVPPGASPHEYNLRPSEAAALQEADLVVWLGKDLSPWLGDAIETLADGATVATLLEADSTVLLSRRENALFEAHDHGDEDDHGEHLENQGHGHGDKHNDEDEHAHEDKHDHDDHTDGDAHEDEELVEHEGHDDHGHGKRDPHAWLSPQNGRIWLDLIAAQLSVADPGNAGTYFENAAAARAEIEALSTDVAEILEPVRGGSFVVFHDAYRYFENAFDFPAAGAISLGDASDPSPARIAEIQGRIREEGIDCVLAEPQFNPGIVGAVLDGVEANTSVIDPLGSDLVPGVELYPEVIRNIARTLAECL